MSLVPANKNWLTDTTDLTAVADAIRAKGGTNKLLVYPTGFVSAIQAIETGITPQLIVTTSAGAAVTATKGSKTVSGTAGTDGTCTLELSEAGEWSVTAAKDGLSSTQTVVIGTQRMTLLLADPVFSNASWAAIIAACHGGSVPSTWAVGDSKTMTIGGTDYQIDIIGKNHDTYADGSGTAPLTFQMHDCYATTYAMNAANTNVGGWKECAMRKTHLPAILALMPAEVQTGIREVNKLTSAGNTSATIETTADKLFLLSEVEVFGTNRFSYAGEGTRYAYYQAGNTATKNRNGSYQKWWTRSPYKSDGENFGTSAYQPAEPDTSGANNSNGVAFGFCF